MDLHATQDTALSGIAPKFPPQNFDVPDITFSNSVTTDMNYDLNYSPAVTTNASGLSGLFSATMSDHAGFVPNPSNSPSSGEDSDDLPLAQLAKRGNTAASPCPSSTSVTAESSPKQGSPGPGTGKRGKTGKKKKKKDPNEPQKPVSAYALFFRDTQATIKGHNPNASFGEISKIVASMWDQLDPDHKENYKKKTEMEKKKYLKQLAAYKANQVSQSTPEESDKTLSPSPPNVSSSSSMTSTSIPVSAGQQSVAMETSDSVSDTRTTLPDSLISQKQNMINLSSPMMQLKMQQSSSPQHLMQHSSVTHAPNQYSSPSHQSSPYTSPPQSGPTTTNNQKSSFTNTNIQFEPQTFPVCSRSGCGNHAIKNPGWDNEYCSNDCVITHCRDIFSSWVAQRSGSFQVK